MVSRRNFFKGLGAAVALAMVGIGVKNVLAGPTDPRLEAWRLLDESEVLFRATGESPEFFTKTNELFDHLTKHFTPSNPPSTGVLIRECGDLIKGRGKYKNNPNSHWRTCYPSTFSVMIVREGLKNRKLPMIMAKNWKPFAGNFTKIVMAA